MRMPREFFSVATLGGIMFLAGCDNMELQANRRALTPSALSANGASARLPPAHTVAWQGERAPNPIGTETTFDPEKSSPPLTAEFLQRGQERYQIYCAMCHGADGYGRGIVVRRGFPAPPSLHDEHQRALAPEHFFDVITHGYGTMLPLGPATSPTDRWAIVAYIAALQRSQHPSPPDFSGAISPTTPTRAREHE